MKSHDEIEILGSAARTASVNTADYRADGHRGVVVLIDVTAIAATPSVVFTVQGKIGSTYYDMLASAAVTNTGQTILKVYPGITAAANASVSDILPESWRVKAVNGDADSITYSIKAVLLP